MALLVAAIRSTFDPGAQPPARSNQLRVDFWRERKTSVPGEKSSSQVEIDLNSAHILYAEVGGVKEDHNTSLTSQECRNFES